jgi:hypothetical protein
MEGEGNTDERKAAVGQGIADASQRVHHGDPIIHGQLPQPGWCEER